MIQLANGRQCILHARPQSNAQLKIEDRETFLPVIIRANKPSSELKCVRTQAITNRVSLISNRGHLSTNSFIARRDATRHTPGEEVY